MSNVIDMAAVRSSRRRSRRRSDGPEPWLTKRQIAEHFGVSVRTIERWRQQADFPGRRVHGDRGVVRFSLAECEEWLERAEAKT